MPGTISVPRGDVKATLNFYGPPTDGSPPFHIYNEEMNSEFQRNYSHCPHDIIIHDVRDQDAEFTIDRNAFQIIEGVPPSKETDFTDDESIQMNFYPEVKELVSAHIPGIDYIFIYNHTIRSQVPGAAYRPLTRVHNDHTPNSIVQRVREYLPTEADELLRHRYRTVNVWCPLNKNPVEECPLAFCSAATVADEDSVTVERRGEDGRFIREVALIKYNPNQKWYYLSGITNNDRVIMECFDSESLKQSSGIRGICPHAAFNDPRTREDAEKRVSIEVRCLLFSK
ncbi:methyltransferase [Metarhizium brunneum]